MQLFKRSRADVFKRGMPAPPVIEALYGPEGDRLISVHA